MTLWDDRTEVLGRRPRIDDLYIGIHRAIVPSFAS